MYIYITICYYYLLICLALQFSFASTRHSHVVKDIRCKVWTVLQYFDEKYLQKEFILLHTKANIAIYVSKHVSVSKDPHQLMDTRLLVCLLLFLEALWKGVMSCIVFDFELFSFVLALFFRIFLSCSCFICLL